MTEVLAAAMAAHEAGLCVLPPKQDGSKAPDADEWTPYQSRRSTIDEINNWYSNGRTGLGAVTGAISGNLELFEFDEGATYRAFLVAAEEAGLGELVRRIRAGYEERTPGGIHWLLRCTEIQGNQKLARRLKRSEERTHDKDTVKVKIETRENRGFVVLAPSHGTVHPTGRPYDLRNGRRVTHYGDADNVC